MLSLNSDYRIKCLNAVHNCQAKQVWLFFGGSGRSPQNQWVDGCLTLNRVCAHIYDICDIYEM